MGHNDAVCDLMVENGNLKRLLTECQAREAKLRDFIDVCIELDDYLPVTVLAALDEVRDIQSDNSALREALKQAKREALLEAADWCKISAAEQDALGEDEFATGLRIAGDHFLHIAEELK